MPSLAEWQVALIGKIFGATGLEQYLDLLPERYALCAGHSGEKIKQKILNKFPFFRASTSFLMDFLIEKLCFFSTSLSSVRTSSGGRNFLTSMVSWVHLDEIM